MVWGARDCDEAEAPGAFESAHDAHAGDLFDLFVDLRVDFGGGVLEFDVGAEALESECAVVEVCHVAFDCSAFFEAFEAVSCGVFAEVECAGECFDALS